MVLFVCGKVMVPKIKDFKPYLYYCLLDREVTTLRVYDIH